MEYIFFEINNFKGIEKLRIDLDNSPKSRFFPLEGLNESGKTTILEAINYFSYKDENLDPLQIPGHSIKDIHTLIPIAKRSNFNGEIICKIGVKLSKEDISKIENYVTKELKYRKPEIGDLIVITHKLKFKDSKNVITENGIYWNWTRNGIAEGKNKKSLIVGKENEDWHNLVRYAKNLMPSILYFPTFLFDFPEKLYLEDKTNSADKKNEFYRLVLQDILDATSSGANLKTHILDRAKSPESSDRKNLDSVLLSMSRNVTNTVFESWNKIFNAPLSDRKVKFNWDKDEDGRIYLQLQLEDSDGNYLISERSLGFRWFFVFLLLTNYRGFRKDSSKNVLFLLDEPASNLHATAQAQLLQSFEALSSKCMVMYTTHSHHLINPNYLDSTYVIKNNAVGYAPLSELNSKNTSISATKYRKFASNYPNQTTYYKPILDVLDYQPSNLEFVPNVIMTEGKTDFYLLKYFSMIILKSPNQRYFLPGTGSGTLDTCLQLYIGWGRDFIVMLDSDKEGIKQQNRYNEKYGLECAKNIFNLQDASQDWSNIGIEKLITDEDKLKMQRYAYPDSDKFNKTHFHRSIQELLMSKELVEISEPSKLNFQTLFSFFDSKLLPMSP